MSYDVVLVEWIDDQTVTTALMDVKDVENIEPLVAKVVGFRIFENKERIVLSQELWEEQDSVEYIHIIPKRSVLKIRKLKVKK